MENKKERIFENTYVAVNFKNKKTLSMNITIDEHVHDNKAIPELVEGILESNSITAIDKLYYLAYMFKL